MSGIFSSSPDAGSIRLLVGTHGLMVVQLLLALFAPQLAIAFRAVIGLTIALAVGSLTAAAFGLPGPDTEPYWRRRRGR